MSQIKNHLQISVGLFIACFLLNQSSLMAVSDLPQLGIDSLGNAITVFQTSDTSDHIQYSIKPVTGSWSAPADISDINYYASMPQFATDGFGNAVAMWYGSHSEGDGDLIASTLVDGGSWSTPVVVSVLGTLILNDFIVKINGNVATAVWSAYDETWSFLDIYSSQAVFTEGSWSSWSTATKITGN